jgi:hypothetical protein
MMIWQPPKRNGKTLKKLEELLQAISDNDVNLVSILLKDGSQDFINLVIAYDLFHGEKINALTLAVCKG